MPSTGNFQEAPVCISTSKISPFMCAVLNGAQAGQKMMPSSLSDHPGIRAKKGIFFVERDGIPSANTDLLKRSGRSGKMHPYILF